MKRLVKFFWPFFVGLLVIFFSIFITEFVDLYEKFPLFDKALHFVGGFIAGWVTWLIFEKEMPKIHILKKFIIVLGGTALLGIVWEFAEYASTGLNYYVPRIDQYLYIGSLRDTLGDLLTDLIGGFVAATFFFRSK